MYIPYIDLEIIFLTKQGRVALDIKEHGKIEAVRRYMNRYKCGLNTALQYIRKVEGEMERAKSN